METESQKFRRYLHVNGFIVTEVLAYQRLIAHYRKTDKGDHTIISSRDCCMFDGIDTKKGDLGCVTFYYNGILKERGKKRVNNSAELLKKVILPNNAEEAIKEFETWRKETNKIIDSWTKVL